MSWKEFLFYESLAILLQVVGFIPWVLEWKQDCKDHGKENLSMTLGDCAFAWFFVFPIWLMPILAL